MSLRGFFADFPLTLAIPISLSRHPAPLPSTLHAECRGSTYTH
jgi:hypothetical protein